MNGNRLPYGLPSFAEVDGPDVALAAIRDLPLDAYAPYNVARADLLRRLGRSADAAAAYDRAIELSTNAAERAFLIGRRAAVLP